MRIERIDHLVLTVADVEQAISFYEEVLGMEAVTFGDGRRAVAFGEQKMNFHEAGHEFEPKADRPTPGSADVCLITRSTASEIESWLRRKHIVPLEGPVHRIGALGPIISFYFRDPDLNLIEVATYASGERE